VKDGHPQRRQVFHRKHSWKTFSAQRTQSLPLFDGKEVKRSKEGHQKKEESENKNKNTFDRDMMYMIKRQSRVASS
jgi:hypothetical protein